MKFINVLSSLRKRRIFFRITILVSILFIINRRFNSSASNWNNLDEGEERSQQRNNKDGLSVGGYIPLAQRQNAASHLNSRLQQGYTGDRVKFDGIGEMDYLRGESDVRMKTKNKYTRWGVHNNDPVITIGNNHVVNPALPAEAAAIGLGNADENFLLLDQATATVTAAGVPSPSSEIHDANPRNNLTTENSNNIQQQQIKQQDNNQIMQQQQQQDSSQMMQQQQDNNQEMQQELSEPNTNEIIEAVQVCGSNFNSMTADSIVDTIKGKEDQWVILGTNGKLLFETLCSSISQNDGNNTSTPTASSKTTIHYYPHGWTKYLGDSYISSDTISMLITTNDESLSDVLSLFRQSTLLMSDKPEKELLSFLPSLTIFIPDNLSEEADKISNVLLSEPAETFKAIAHKSKTKGKDNPQVAIISSESSASSNAMNPGHDLQRFIQSTQRFVILAGAQQNEGIHTIVHRLKQHISK
jgi:hypothetical protein